MKKRCLIYLFLLAASLAACAKRSVPVYSDAGSLARSLYDTAGFETEAIYCEELEDTSAYLFGVTVTEFDDMVEDAVCWRKVVDSNGQLLYALKMRSDRDAKTLAERFFRHYEFAPCDAAEKLAVACAGEYFIVFKSALSEVDAATEAFRTMMDGAVRFEKELYNRM